MVCLPYVYVNICVCSYATWNLPIMNMQMSWTKVTKTTVHSVDNNHTLVTRNRRPISLENHFPPITWRWIFRFIGPFRNRWWIPNSKKKNPISFTYNLNNKYAVITELNAVEEFLVKCRRNGSSTQRFDRLIYAIDYEQTVALIKHLKQELCWKYHLLTELRFTCSIIKYYWVNSLRLSHQFNAVWQQRHLWWSWLNKWNSMMIYEMDDLLIMR